MVPLLSFAITDGHVHDTKAKIKLLKSLKERIRKIFGNKGYDSKSIYNIFGENAMIAPRKYESLKSRGSPARARIFRLIKKTSENEWKESVGFGMGWNVEIYFSGPKRTMGEVKKTVKPDYIARESASKVQYFNILVKMTHAY